ncbi:hypothetical protein ALQ99_101606 [Pseudomonas syringae pv. lapsa]|uniref:Uncharacterized protein n=1 Tax=Pseudomonas syringae pv. lapsa TaxID=199201 RepID=A0AB74A0F3_PSESX|nr:hypothetical protein ALO39_101725 [Pseudomonas syringae pv. lapsa]RML15637.1 hypothetical protein ALQ99_101606 [Pseudomonas syringae pv. lapsa]RML22992.1 hypothetical protein ALQ98_101396 [Pseudomonas syringae pv. lapsa]
MEPDQHAPAPRKNQNTDDQKRLSPQSGTAVAQRVDAWC